MGYSNPKESGFGEPRSRPRVRFKGWHSRGYLPHYESQDIVQFVTYRLADSIPQETLERIQLSDRPESL